MVTEQERTYVYVCVRLKKGQGPTTSATQASNNSDPSLLVKWESADMVWLFLLFFSLQREEQLEDK